MSLTGRRRIVREESERGERRCMLEDYRYSYIYMRRVRLHILGTGGAQAVHPSEPDKYGWRRGCRGKRRPHSGN